MRGRASLRLIAIGVGCLPVPADSKDDPPVAPPPATMDATGVPTEYPAYATTERRYSDPTPTPGAAGILEEDDALCSLTRLFLGSTATYAGTVLSSELVHVSPLDEMAREAIDSQIRWGRRTPIHGAGILEDLVQVVELRVDWSVPHDDAEVILLVSLAGTYYLDGLALITVTNPKSLAPGDRILAFARPIEVAEYPDAWHVCSTTHRRLDRVADEASETLVRDRIEALADASANAFAQRSSRERLGWIEGSVTGFVKSYEPERGASYTMTLDDVHARDGAFDVPSPLDVLFSRLTRNPIGLLPCGISPDVERGQFVLLSLCRAADGSYYACEDAWGLLREEAAAGAEMEKTLWRGARFVR